MQVVNEIRIQFLYTMTEVKADICRKTYEVEGNRVRIHTRRRGERSALFKWPMVNVG